MTTDRYRPLSAFAIAFAAEYKGFMVANEISNLQIAKKLSRNDGYVSERANGKRPLDTEDVDALAMLVPGWTGKELMIELARRAKETTKLAPVTSIRPNVGAATEDEPGAQQPPAKQRTAARKGARKADKAPTAE